MNLLEALARKLKNDWTGGASGDPGRYHAPGAFKDFRIADLFNNDRWTREPMVDPNSISGYLENRDDTPRYTSYYKPRGAVDVTETEKIDNKGETTTQVVTKYQVGKPEVTSEPFPRVAGSGARVSDPMNTRPGTFIGSLHHPPNIAGMGSEASNSQAFPYGSLDSSVTSEPYNPTPYNPGGGGYDVYQYDPDPDLHLKFSTFPYNSTPYNPGGVNQRPIYSGVSNPKPSPVNLVLWRRRAREVFTKLMEIGYSKEEAAKATATFLAGGDVPIGLLERAN
jgi:hypothetical protein